MFRGPAAQRHSAFVRQSRTDRLNCIPAHCRAQRLRASLRGSREEKEGCFAKSRPRKFSGPQASTDSHVPELAGNPTASPVTTRQWSANLSICWKLRRKNSFGTPHGATYNIAMKTIQITMDEELLARLDKAEEVQKIGRSAVLRRATSEYLARQSRVEIARQYRKAYGANADLGKEFKGWEGEAAWMGK